MTTALVLLLLGGWKAYTADVELPVPSGWRFDPNVMSPHPAVPARGLGCENWIWFDVIPGASLEHAQALIATESLDATAAIRRWDVAPYRDVELAGRRAAAMHDGADRTVYVVAFEGGALIAQAMAYGEHAPKCVPLHDGVAAVLVKLFFAPAVQQQVKRVTQGKKAPPLKELPPVPATLDEALAMLEQNTDAASLAELRKSTSEREMYALHLGTGMGIRNGWGLWGGSPLAKFFHGLGVHHPDDMSGIILRSFWRKLHGQPIDLEGQAAVSRRYWALRRPPEPLQPCADGSTPKRLMGLEGEDRFVQIYQCGRRAYAAYELDAGWYAPDERVRKRVEALRREGNVVSAPLEDVSGGTVTDLGERKR